MKWKGRDRSRDLEVKIRKSRLGQRRKEGCEAKFWIAERREPKGEVQI